VKWNEYDKALKIPFPTILDLGTLTYSIPDGFIRTVLAEKPIPYKLRPCEIKTIRLPFDRKNAPREVNLLEGLS